MTANAPNRTAMPTTRGAVRLPLSGAGRRSGSRSGRGIRLRGRPVRPAGAGEPTGRATGKGLVGRVAGAVNVRLQASHRSGSDSAGTGFRARTSVTGGRERLRVARL